MNAKYFYSYLIYDILFKSDWLNDQKSVQAGMALNLVAQGNMVISTPYLTTVL